MKPRKLFCLLLALVLSVSLTMSVYAAPQTDADVHIRHILDYYRCYQADASGEIRVWLRAMENVDPEQSVAWRKIMDTWQWIDQEMEIHYGELPDGLPQDSSLGIVVMGFGLNADGSMREELRDRLQVALYSAQKYPNAYLICTGGATASDSDNTEAGVMAQWLIDKGIPARRVIEEPNSYSTIHNALFTYNLLLNDHPEIQSLAVITSDYHIYRSVLYFSAVPEYFGAMSGTRVIPVVGSACCYADEGARENPNMIADGLAYMAGVSLDWQTKPALFVR